MLPITYSKIITTTTREWIEETLIYLSLKKNKKVLFSFEED